MTGCLVFIWPNSPGQAAVACILAVVSVGVFAVIRPYSDRRDNRAYTLGVLIIFLTVFMGLVIKVIFTCDSNQVVFAILSRPLSLFGMVYFCG